MKVSKFDKSFFFTHPLESLLVLTRVVYPPGNRSDLALFFQFRPGKKNPGKFVSVPKHFWDYSNLPILMDFRKRLEALKNGCEPKEVYCFP